MLIDWFTVGAQVVNFLILVWLLKRFLYKPILHAIDERERRIAKELADADTRKTEAEKERDKFQKRNDEFDEQREELLSKAKGEARAESRAPPRGIAAGGRRPCVPNKQDAMRNANSSTLHQRRNHAAEPWKKFLPSRARR
jgi:hypothetical protein